MPWYLLPGLPNPTISQGVYSTLAPLSFSGKEACTRKLVGTEHFLRKRGLQGLLGYDMQQFGAETAYHIDLHEQNTN